MDGAVSNVLVVEKRKMQPARRRQSLDREALQCGSQAAERLLPAVAANDQLAEKAIVKGRHDIALIQHRVEADALALWRPKANDAAGRRHEPLGGVLSV